MCSRLPDWHKYRELFLNIITSVLTYYGCGVMFFCAKGNKFLLQ